MSQQFKDIMDLENFPEQLCQMIVNEKRKPESTLRDYNPDSSMPGLECGKSNGGFTGFE